MSVNQLKTCTVYKESTPTSESENNFVRFYRTYITFSSPSVSMIFIECKRENGNYVLVTNATTRRALIDHPIPV